jgi:regulator of protease activity HflC (stomatin/prohibitin superfamily)
LVLSTNRYVIIVKTYKDIKIDQASFRSVSQMNLSSLLGLIALVGFIVAGLGVVLFVSNSVAPQNQRKSGGPAGALIVLGLVIGALFFTASSGLVEVGPSEVAVVFQRIGGDPKNNSLWPEPLGPGIHIITPIINEPTIYSTERQNYTMARSMNEGQRQGDDSIEGRTSDGQVVKIDVSVIYAVSPTKANIVHIRWKKRYQDEFVRSTVRSVTRERVARYSVSQLYVSSGTGGSSQLAVLEDEIEKELTAQFDENGLILGNFQLRETTFSDEYVKAIEQRRVAAELAEQAKLEADRARTIAQGRADAAVTEAKGEANANIEKARGEAQAIELRAGADAKALALISEQLNKNPLLIQWRYIEKLAQNISLVLLPNNGPFLFDPTTLGNQNSRPPAQATPQATPTQ